MAFDGYMKIADIPGEAKDSTHKDWIEITGYSFGNSQSATATANSAGGCHFRPHQTFRFQRY